MNRQIRGLALALMACFLLLFVQVNLLQVGDRSCAGVIGAVWGDTCRVGLDHDSRNTRAILRDFSRPRGAIATADGVVIAKSIDSNDRYKYQRVYPTNELFGQITGYFSFEYGAAGLERSYNDALSGQTERQQLRSFSDLFVNRDHTGNVTLTMRNDLQQAARDSLGDRQGSVVVLDPRDGAILALWSNPSYDPNPLSHHDTNDNHSARDARTKLDDAPGAPLLNKTYQEHYPPGSTFKLVTAAIGVDTGKVTKEKPSYPGVTNYSAPVPYGKPISNFSGETCGGTLFNILAMSCNSAFAQMGTETIGPKAMINGVEKFGFGSDIPIDLPGAQGSSTFRPPTSTDDPNGDFTRNLPNLAQGSIGQGYTQASPLEMALVTAGIANNGVIMTPHVMADVRDTDGKVVNTYRPKAWRRAMKSSTARTMREAMEGVVTGGTATTMAIPGFTVGAKTGTAEVGTPEQAMNDAWMVAWAGPEGGAPTVVVAVVVPRVPGHGNASTGSVVAGRERQYVFVWACGHPRHSGKFECAADSSDHDITVRVGDPSLRCWTWSCQSVHQRGKFRFGLPAVACASQS